jgi:hypothetical protein
MILHYRRFRPNLGLLPRILLAGGYRLRDDPRDRGRRGGRAAARGRRAGALGGAAPASAARDASLAGESGSTHVYEGEFRVVTPERTSPGALHGP